MPEPERSVEELRQTIKMLEEEIAVLRRRLQDAPRRVRVLEERLIEAIQDEETRDVTRLLGDGASANATTEMGMPAVSYAAHQGYENIVRALIDAGADVNAKDQPGATALMYAAAGGHMDPPAGTGFLKDPPHFFQLKSFVQFADGFG